MTIRLKAFVTMAMAVIGLLLLTPAAHAQGDGPRAFQLLPADTQVMSLWGMSNKGNQTADTGSVVRGSEIDINLGVLMYIRTLELGGQQSALFVIQPFGKVDASLDLGTQRVGASSSGLADLQIGGIFGVVGSPNLAPKDYAAYKPESTAVGVLGMLTLPTGRYDETRAINLGANRWNLRLGVPMTRYIGNSLVDPALMTVEFQPSVTVFGANDAPFGAVKRTQAALFKLEGHLGRNFSPAVWASIDALATYGGETTTDGVKGDDAQRAFSMGASVNVALSRSATLKTSYGKVLSRNDGGPEGHMLRVIGAVAF